MQRRALFISFAIALSVTGSLFAQTFGAVLSSSQEVPACAATGFGNATVTFDSTRQNINVTITVSNLGSPIIASHIHRGAAGVAGPVVRGFTPDASFTNGKLTGTFPITSDLATEILQNPANFYVNVHTTQCPDGAARGQLSLGSGGPITYAAELRGSSEVPPTGSSAFGSALVTLDPINNTVAWEVNSSGVVSPIQSHIHRGSSAVTGPVIINFATSAAQIPNGHTSGFDTLTGARVTSQFMASDLIALSTASTALGYYVNLHSTAFPGGEIRGPLMPAQEVDIPIAGHVTNGVGQTFISDVRIFNPSFDTPTTALVEFFQVGTTAHTTATSSMAVNLPARGTAVLNDVAGSSGLNVTSIGAIRITSVANVVATSRIYVNSSNGSFGQFVPGFNRSSALRRGVMPQVSNTSFPAGFRANLGVFNPNPSAVTARLEVRDSAGTLLGSNVITLQALSQQQNPIATYFPASDLSNASNLTVSFDASSGIFAYVAETDNLSGDSFLIAGQPDPGVAASQ